MTNAEYKSVEQRIGDWMINTFRNPIKNFVAGAYGTIAAIHRIPTTIRKKRNEEWILDRESDESDNLKESKLKFWTTRGGPAALGYFATALPYASILEHNLVNAERGNWEPLTLQLGVLAATNLVSLVYEAHKKYKITRR